MLMSSNNNVHFVFQVAKLGSMLHIVFLKSHIHIKAGGIDSTNLAIVNIKLLKDPFSGWTIIAFAQVNNGNEVKPVNVFVRRTCLITRGLGYFCGKDTS